jgi:hypothetical protein
LQRQRFGHKLACDRLWIARRAGGLDIIGGIGTADADEGEYHGENAVESLGLSLHNHVDFLALFYLMLAP